MKKEKEGDGGEEKNKYLISKTAEFRLNWKGRALAVPMFTLFCWKRRSVPRLVVPPLYNIPTPSMYTVERTMAELCA